MKRGQTSVLHFGGRIIMSIAGFAVNFYIARILGSEVLGTYVLILSVIAWMTMTSDLGFHQSIRKRMSEGDNQYQIVATAIVIQASLLVVFAGLLLIFQRQFEQYVGASVGEIVVIMLIVNVGTNFVQAVLDGQQKVQYSSLIPPIWWTGRGVFQIGLMVLGYALVGLLWGYVLAGVIAIGVGVFFVSTRIVRPALDSARELASFARYSWVNPFKSRTFLSMDTIILGFYVGTGLIGVYEITWNLASLFAIFASSIGTVLFPEMSSLNASNRHEKVRDTISASLAYAGLFLIPGLVGSAIVGEEVLSIYGSEFVAGYEILLILVLARLVYAYQIQMANALDAMDHPEETYRINIMFIATNLVLNVLLVSRYGWYGAAIATTTTAGLSVTLSYMRLIEYIPIELPWREIARQFLSAGLMGVVVLAGKVVLGNSIPVVLALVAVGVVTYFGVLFTISRQFQKTVRDNLPDAFG